MSAQSFDWPFTLNSEATRFSGWCFTSDKRVLDQVATFAHIPSGFIQQINHILACPGDTIQELTRAVSELEQVWSSIATLPEVAYEPKFRL